MIVFLVIGFIGGYSILYSGLSAITGGKPVSALQAFVGPTKAKGPAPASTTSAASDSTPGPTHGGKGAA